MKKILASIAVIFVFNAYANIEYEGYVAEPTTQEISKNRACFDELLKQGCGDPGEDQKQFRSCLHDSYSSLSQDCQKMMSYLYSKKR